MPLVSCSNITSLDCYTLSRVGAESCDPQQPQSDDAAANATFLASINAIQLQHRW